MMLVGGDVKKGKTRGSNGQIEISEAWLRAGKHNHFWKTVKKTNKV